MRMRFEMRLCFVAEYVHLILVETLIAAELQLLFAVLKVHIIDSMANVFTPVADLVLLEGRATALRETQFAAKRFITAACGA